MQAMRQNGYVRFIRGNELSVEPDDFAVARLNHERPFALVCFPTCKTYEIGLAERNPCLPKSL